LTPSLPSLNRSLHTSFRIPLIGLIAPAFLAAKSPSSCPFANHRFVGVIGPSSFFPHGHLCLPSAHRGPGNPLSVPLSLCTLFPHHFFFPRSAWAAFLFHVAAISMFLQRILSAAHQLPLRVAPPPWWVTCLGQVFGTLERVQLETGASCKQPPPKLLLCNRSPGIFLLLRPRFSLPTLELTVPPGGIAIGQDLPNFGRHVFPSSFRT